MGIIITNSGILRVRSGTLANNGGVGGPVNCPARTAFYVNTVLADSPAVYYRFNEASGPTATDSSGNGRDGTYVGAQHTFQQNPGPTGCTNDEYVAQNNSGSSVDVTNVAFDVIGSPGQDFTFEMWTQIPASGFGFALIDKTTTGSPFNWNSLAIVNSITGRVRGQLLDGASNPVIDGATAVNDGLWHHCVLVADRTVNGEIRLYVDGVSDAAPVAIPSNGSFDSSNTRQLEFGDRDAGSGAGSLVGDMAHGAVYLSALSPARILAHFNAADSGT